MQFSGLVLMAIGVMLSLRVVSSITFYRSRCADGRQRLKPPGNFIQNHLWLPTFDSTTNMPLLLALSTFLSAIPNAILADDVPHRLLTAASAPVIQNGKVVKPEDFGSTPRSAVGRELLELISVRNTLRALRSEILSGKGAKDETRRAFNKAVIGIAVSDVTELSSFGAASLGDFLTEITKGIGRSKDAARSIWQADIGIVAVNNRIHDLAENLIENKQVESAMLKSNLSLTSGTVKRDGGLQTYLGIRNRSTKTLPWLAVLIETDCEYDPSVKEDGVIGIRGSDLTARTQFESMPQRSMYFVKSLEPGEFIRLIHMDALSYLRAAKDVRIRVRSAYGFAQLEFSCVNSKPKLARAFKKFLTDQQKALSAVGLPDMSSENIENEDRLHKGSVWKGSLRLTAGQPIRGMNIRKNNSADVYINGRDDAGKFSGFVSLNGQTNIMSLSLIHI